MGDAAQAAALLSQASAKPERGSSGPYSTCESGPLIAPEALGTGLQWSRSHRAAVVLGKRRAAVKPYLTELSNAIAAAIVTGVIDEIH